MTLKEAKASFTSNAAFSVTFTTSFITKMGTIVMSTSSLLLYTQEYSDQDKAKNILANIGLISSLI
jgi:hypothetical protein